MTAMIQRPPSLRRIAPARAQRGVSLLFALLTLVALTLSALALVRSVDTSALMLGNVGFKQDATAAADQATREVIAWLSANKFNLNSNVATKGYFASNQEFEDDGTTVKPPLDVTGRQLEGTANRQLIDWDGNNCQGVISGTYTGCAIDPVAGTDVGGNKVSYVVLRLCSKAGDYTTDTAINCAKYYGAGSSTTQDHGDLNYTTRPELRAAASPYYRILVRVSGARNTTSFTETIVHF